VLLRRVELGDLLRDRREQSERERGEAQQPKNEKEGEESELADAPPLGAPWFSPEERQDRGSLAPS
jgi:hypothetical protein